MGRQGMKVRAQSIPEIKELRERAEERLLKLPNVIGSMIGAKIKSGNLKKKIGLTLFVAEKISPEKLGPKEQIPRQITIEGRTLQTDVLEIRSLRPQSSIFPRVLVVSDGHESGTVSSLCSSPHGFFGLTCAHVISATERNPATPDPVEIWSPLKRDYVRIGNSLYAFMSSGAGTEDDFGFADAALFTLDYPELVARAKGAAVIPAAEPEIGETVQGDGGTHGTLTGTVLGIQKKVENMLIDVCVQVDAPGTFKGDSGMLWKNKGGKPVAIHAYGERGLPLDGSKFSGSMLASRAAKLLNFEFLKEP